MTDADCFQRMSKLIMDGRVSDVAALLDSGIDPNGVESLWSPLLSAAEHEQPEIMRLLVSRGADVNHSDSNNWTPLHNAVDIAIDGTIQCRLPEINWECVGVLLDLGANPKLKCVRGKTPWDIVDDYGVKARSSKAFGTPSLFAQRAITSYNPR